MQCYVLRQNTNEYEKMETCEAHFTHQKMAQLQAAASYLCKALEFSDTEKQKY